MFVLLLNFSYKLYVVQETDTYRRIGTKKDID